MVAGPLHFEGVLKAFLVFLFLFITAVNYASYMKLMSRTIETHVNATRVPRLSQAHMAWKRTERDPFQMPTDLGETEPPAASSKGIIQEFIELVAPTEAPDSANVTDDLAVENAVSLERDTGE